MHTRIDTLISCSIIRRPGSFVSIPRISDISAVLMTGLKRDAFEIRTEREIGKEYYSSGKVSGSHLIFLCRAITYESQKGTRPMTSAYKVIPSAHISCARPL